MSLVKSKQRVADHGEVFTPAWMVEAMLDLVKGETERIDSRFLEPACGSGNFLVRILQRKLAAVELKFGKSNFEKRHYALLAIGLLELEFDCGELALQYPDKEVSAPASGLQKAGVNALGLALDEVEHRLNHPRRGEYLPVVGDALF